LALTAGRGRDASSPTLAAMADDQPSDAGPVPPFPDALVAEAAAKPGGWVYAIDPAYDPNGTVPPEGIAGAWRVGADGRPTGEYRPNRAHRPTGP
jgi:hypothetical protein